MKAPLFLTAVLYLSTPLPAIAQSTKVSQHDIKTIVQEWNTAHNARNIVKLESLYAQNLQFYGHELNLIKCLNKKVILFNTYTDYHQEITSDALKLTVYSSGNLQCDFTKRVTTGDKTNLYPCYLLLRKTAAGYQITGESDSLTDRSAKHNPTSETGSTSSISISIQTPAHSHQTTRHYS